MAKTTILIGIVLVVMGVVGYTTTGGLTPMGTQYPMTLLPVFAGGALCVLGALARSEDTKRRMLVMHIAVAIALVGFLFTAKSIWDYLRMEAGKSFAYPTTVADKAAMSVLLLF